MTARFYWSQRNPRGHRPRLLCSCCLSSSKSLICGFCSLLPLGGDPAAGAVVTVDQPSTFDRLGLIQAVVEIIREKVPQATDSDFHICGSFHSVRRRSLFSLHETSSFRVGLVVSGATGYRPPSIRVRNRPEHPMQYARFKRLATSLGRQPLLQERA